jgi:hypothetical protein
VFDSLNLAEATYPRQPIIQNEFQLLAVLANYNKTNRKDDTIHDWYEALHINMEATGRYERNRAQTLLLVSGQEFAVPKYLDDHTPAQVAAQFWKLATAQPAVSRHILPSSEKRRGRPTGYTIDLIRANEAIEAIRAKVIKMPKQVVGILQVLVGEEFDFYTAAEMQRLANTARFYKHVSTTQDGWRIFRYYTPQLRELGVLK